MESPSLRQDERSALGELLCDVRRRAGLTQIDLADRLGRPQSYVSRYETGTRRLDVLELRAVCTACGITISKFIEELESKLT